MSLPWEVLGIPSGSSAAEIKRAYAKLLRQHRPDVDPVGFRRLRDAYESALAWAESGGAIPDPLDFDDEADSPPITLVVDTAPSSALLAHADGSPSGGSRPRDLAKSLREALRRARDGDRPQRLDRLARLLARLLEQRRGDAELARLALDELGHENSSLRSHLRPGRPYGASAVDGVTLGRALLLAHVAARDLRCLWAAVDELTGLVEATSAPDVVVQALDAIPALALLDPARAAKLADVVFRRAPPELRQVLGTTEVWIEAGKQLRERHLEETRRILMLAMCDPRVGDEHAAARSALELAVKAPRAPLVAELLAERFPTAWPQFEPQWRSARNRLGKRPPAVEEGGRDWRLVFWLVIALGILARLVAAWAGSSPSFPRFRIDRIEVHPSGWHSSNGSPEGKR